MFYEKLTELRKQRGLSQEELGEAVGVTRQTVSKWELGLTTPELDKLVELSVFFDCSVDYLVGKKDAPMPENKAQERGLPPHKFAYEYKSKKTLFGLPLVHIHLGFGFCRAKGIIAIGNIATGFVALASNIAAGGFANGHIAVGAATQGDILFNLEQSAVAAEQIRQAILKEYPKIWKWVADLFALFGR